MNKEKKTGVIYILTNPSFPDYVKIGYAHNIETRLKQLNRSETIPFAFRVYAVYKVDSALTDKELHKLIDKLNPDLRGTLDRLQRLTPEGHEILDEQIANEVRETARRGPFRFSECNIPVGSEIAFIEDETIKAIVVDDRHIEYEGETTSVSALAQKLKGFEHPVQGTLWFTYQGERLTDLRDRLEASLR